MRKQFYNFILFLLLGLTSCNIGAGTHGSLKSYQYPITKHKLEKAVMTVLKDNPKIFIDDIQNYIIDNTNGKNDTIRNNSYNDTTTYLTIKINTDKELNEYTIRYSGDEESWKTDSTSSISICYAYDKFGKGGSEGNGGVGRKLLKQLVNVFELELIEKIDKELNLTHSSEE